MTDLLGDIFGQLMESKIIRRTLFVVLMAAALYVTDTYTTALGCWAFLLAIFGIAEITDRR